MLIFDVIDEGFPLSFVLATDIDSVSLIKYFFHGCIDSHSYFFADVIDILF